MQVAPILALMRRVITHLGTEENHSKTLRLTICVVSA